MRKKLYIDGQLFQTGDWSRGMGKITVDYLRALLRQPAFQNTWEIAIVYSETLRDAQREKEVRAVFPEITDVTYLPFVLPADGLDYTQAAPKNRQILDDFLSEAPDDAAFFIPGLFVHDIYPVFPARLKKIVLFHDIIPLLFPENYLREEWQRSYYFQRFPAIFESDLILANSDTTKDDLVRFLNIAPERIATVYGAGFDRRAYKPARPQGLPKKPFVFFPTGDDFRKNNVRCVEAFKQFNKTHTDTYQLVVPSTFGEGTKQQLLNITPDVVFVGNVSDGEFRWLLQHAEMVFFGTSYEGLGLPLLEAMADGAERIVCSNITVFQQIVEDDPVHFSDPNSPASMAVALETALQAQPAKQYDALKRFTWERTGMLLDEAFAALAKQPVKAPVAKPKIAIVGPDPRGFSSIGKFLQELHPACSEVFACDYYFEMSTLTSGMPKASYLPYVANHYDVTQLTPERYAEYDAVWYHIGNSDFHIETIKHALLYPGYIVLHDTRLRGLYDQLVQRGHISDTRYLTEESFGGLREAEFIASLVNSARGIMVHSEDAKEKILHQMIVPDEKHVTKLYHPVSTGGKVRKRSEVTLGFGGFTTPRADPLGLSLIKQMLEDKRFANCRFEVFGFHSSANGESLVGAVMEEFSGDPRIHVTANLNDLEFQDKLRDLDIIMNFRPVYSGETSRFTLEAMRYGDCVVVRDVGWYHELPDDAACKVARAEDIVNAVGHLVENNELRQRIQRNATAFTEECRVEVYAQTMHTMMQQNTLASMPESYKAVWRSALRLIPHASTNKSEELLS